MSLLIDYFTLSVLFFLVDVVMKEFDDQVDMSEDHSSAAVALATQLIQSIAESETKLLAKLICASKLCAESPFFDTQTDRLNMGTYEVETFWWSMRSRYLFHLLPTTYTVKAKVLDFHVHQFIG